MAIFVCFSVFLVFVFVPVLSEFLTVDPVADPTIQVMATENGVAIIKKENLRKLLAQNQILMIMCYVPWDPKYNSKISEYEKIAKPVYEKTNDVMLAKLDMAAEPIAAGSLEVRPPELQYVLFFRGIGYNMDEFPNAKALSAMVQEMSKRDFSVPEVPYGETPIKNLTKPDFDRLTKHKDFSLVIFYLPESPAAERLLYSFRLAVHGLKKDKKYAYYQFDATNKPDTLERFGLKQDQLPALKVFRKGKVFDYNGPLVNPAAIAKYLKGHREEPYTELDHPDQLETFLKNNPDRATIVGFFASKALKKFPLFVDAAQLFRDQHSFVLMDTPMVSNAGSEPQQVPGWTMAVFLPKRWHTPDDEKKAVLHHEDASYEMITDFIRWKSTPLSGERTLKNAKLTYSLRPLVVVYGNIDWSKAHRKDTEYIRDKVARAAKDHKDILFAISNSSVFQHEVERFGFDMDPKYEIHVGIIGKDGEYYPRWDTAHMSSKMISDFVKQFKDGEIKPFYRNHKNAQANTNITELTGETFQSEVMKSDSHTLVLFYHPLSRTWRAAEAAVRDLARDPEFSYRNLDFAELDCSNNDVPAFIKLDTYPSLYLIPKNDKKSPILYPGIVFEEHMVRHWVFAELGKLFKKEQTLTKETKTEL